VCRRHLDEVLIRPDGMHFEGPGAVWASHWMLEQVRAASVTKATSP
jgi:hypothetical protein